MTFSTENAQRFAPSPKSTKSRNLDFLICRGTNSNRNFGLIWLCTHKFDFLDLVDLGGVANSVESVIEGPDLKSAPWFFHLWRYCTYWHYRTRWVCKKKNSTAFTQTALYSLQESCKHTKHTCRWNMSITGIFLFRFLNTVFFLEIFTFSPRPLFTKSINTSATHTQNKACGWNVPKTG